MFRLQVFNTLLRTHFAASLLTLWIQNISKSSSHYVCIQQWTPYLVESLQSGYRKSSYWNYRRQNDMAHPLRLGYQSTLHHSLPDLNNLTETSKKESKCSLFQHFTVLSERLSLFVLFLASSNAFLFLHWSLISCQGLRASEEIKIHQTGKIISAFNRDNDMLFSVDTRGHLYYVTVNKRRKTQQNEGETSLLTKKQRLPVGAGVQTVSS